MIKKIPKQLNILKFKKNVNTSMLILILNSYVTKSWKMKFLLILKSLDCSSFVFIFVSKRKIYHFFVIVTHKCVIFCKNWKISILLFIYSILHVYHDIYKKLKLGRKQ